MAKPRAWTFTTEDGDVMLSDTYPLPDVVRDFESDAPIRATTLRGYHVGLKLFLEWLGAKNNIARPTVADLTHENATAFATNFRPEDRRAGRYTERNKLVALKALAKWLAEKHLYYEQRGDQRLSILRDVKLPPIPAIGRRPFDDREVKEIIAAIPRVATYPIRERAILTLQFSAPMRSARRRSLTTSRGRSKRSRRQATRSIRRSMRRAFMPRRPLAPTPLPSAKGSRVTPRRCCCGTRVTPLMPSAR
jgi:site-specific recombinase XerD